MPRGTWGFVPGTAEGTVPCHPSAWCKVEQGWVNLQASKGVRSISLADVKGTAVIKALKPSVSSTNSTDNTGVVYKLWTNGDANSKEYFLIESRKKYGFDRSLPGEGPLSKFTALSSMSNLRRQFSSSTFATHMQSGT